MGEQENIEFLNGENEEIESNDDLFNITSWGADPSVRELITMYKEGDIVIPELQRKYVWDKKEASRFIESLLLGLPVPSVFFANTDNNTRLIIDGYQRIKTIVDYYSGIWTGDNSVFKLTKSDKINIRWRDKAYVDLSEDDKRRFRNYTIHAIIFEQKHPQNDSGLFQIFERINTSGKSLNAQEIRNCVSQGKMNSLLFKLNKNSDWRFLFGSDDENPRMLDLEFILRYFALGQKEIIESTKNHICLKKLLNDYMSSHIDGVDSFFEGLESQFINTVSFIRTHFGESAFYNLQSDLKTLRKRFYPTIYDSLMIATSIALKHGFQSDSNLEDKRLTLLKDEAYRNSITQATMQTVNIKTRISRALELIYGLKYSDYE